MDTITAGKRCPRCETEKDLSEFGVWGKYMGAKAGLPRTYCRSCEMLNSREAYRKRRAKQAFANGAEPGAKFLAYVTAPNGQMLGLYDRGGVYLLREDRD